MKLTNEQGNPMQLTSIATTIPYNVGFGQHSAATTSMGADTTTIGIGTYVGQIGANLLAKEPRTDISVHDYTK